METTWLNEITLDMIPDGIHRAIAQKIGVANLIKLSEVIGGTTFYIRKRSGLIVPIRNMKIAREFDGKNRSELARKYGISRAWLNQILRNTEAINERPNDACRKY